MNLLYDLAPLSPVAKMRNNKSTYRPLWLALQKIGFDRWIAVPADAVGGDTPEITNKILRASARRRKLRIQIVHENGLVYVRMPRPLSPSTCSPVGYQ
jgi:hypothetical protein